MRKYLFGLMVMGLLAACKSQQSTATQETAAPSVDSVASQTVPRNFVVADATTPFVVLGASIDSLNGVPVVRFDKQMYRVETSAETDPNRRLPVTNEHYGFQPDSGTTATQADSMNRVYSFGYDAVYTIRLIDPDGKAKFTTRLRKPDFASFMDPRFLAECIAEKPQFLGWLTKFNALAFNVHFYPDGTDVGADALLLLDAASGKVRSITANSYAGTGDGSNELTPDGQVLLTGYDILHASGQRISLERKKATNAGTLLINATTALAVYDYEDQPTTTQRKSRVPNAQIINLQGRRLGSFQLSGIRADMGYMLPVTYLRHTHTYYLFDSETKTLHLLPQDKPLTHSHKRLNEITKFTASQLPTEVRFRVTTYYGGQLELYADTVNGNLRYAEN